MDKFATHWDLACALGAVVIFIVVHIWSTTDRVDSSIRILAHHIDRLKATVDDLKVTVNDLKEKVEKLERAR